MRLARATVAVFLLAGCGGEPNRLSSSSEALHSEERDHRHLPRQFELARDPAGIVASFSRHGFDAGDTNGFFTALGSNGRSCNSCHRQEDGWTISARGNRALASADPHDPLFAPVDGSDCPPTSPTKGPDAAASSLTVDYGVIRIQLPVPATADFTLAGATNPKNCAIAPGDASIGGELFLFRRPLPTANLVFLSTVMWDGRETIQKITTGKGLTGLGPLFFDLRHQDNGATLGHEQASQPILGTPVSDDLVNFETDLFNAQLKLGHLELDRDGGHGGPRFLADEVARRFFIGINDPLQPGFSSRIFTLYRDWEHLDCDDDRDHDRGRARECEDGSGHDRDCHDDHRRCDRDREHGDDHRDHCEELDGLRAAIGRGEKLFNERTFTIANVAGINSASGDVLANPADPLFNTPVLGTCGTCHNNPNVGNHSTSLPINIGVTLAHPRDNLGNSIEGILDVGNLPVYTLHAAAGDLEVTDPGRALISGKFVDAGKTKGPNLRGLAARAPYFHNGSAKDLATVVEFYDRRFQIGLTDAESRDLVRFLEAL